MAWGYRLLEAAGKKRGFLISGGEVDTERMAKILLDEYRAGKLGRFHTGNAGGDGTACSVRMREARL